MIPEKKKKIKDRVREVTDKYFSRVYIKNNIVVICNTIFLTILFAVVFGIGVYFYKWVESRDIDYPKLYFKICKFSTEKKSKFSTK